MNMQYVFNSTLLRTLPSVLGKNPSVMSEYVTDIAYYTIVRAIKDGDMVLTKFVSLCNGLHLDWRYFFVQEECYVPKAELEVPDDQWEPIVFHGDRVENYNKKIYAIKCTHFAWLLNQRHYNVDKFFSGGYKSTIDSDTAKASSSFSLPSASSIRKTGKAQYNSLLFDHLPQLTGISLTAIMRSVGKSKAVFRWANKNKDVRIRTLVGVCNNMHINIKNFFIYSDTLYIPSNLIVSSDEWKPVVFHPERFQDFMIDARDNSGIVALCKIMECSYGKFQRIIGEDSTLSAVDLVNFCDRLGCSPMYFFDTEVDSSDVHAVAQMQSRIKELEQKIKRLNSEKLQTESRLRHANAMLDLKQSINK